MIDYQNKICICRLWHSELHLSGCRLGLASFHHNGHQKSRERARSWKRPTDILSCELQRKVHYCQIPLRLFDCVMHCLLLHMAGRLVRWLWFRGRTESNVVLGLEMWWADVDSFSFALIYTRSNQLDLLSCTFSLFFFLAQINLYIIHCEILPGQGKL